MKKDSLFKKLMFACDGYVTEEKGLGLIVIVPYVITAVILFYNIYTKTINSIHLWIAAIAYLIVLEVFYLGRAKYEPIANFGHGVSRKFKAIGHSSLVLTITITFTAVFGVFLFMLYSLAKYVLKGRIAMIVVFLVWLFFYANYRIAKKMNRGTTK